MSVKTGTYKMVLVGLIMGGSLVTSASQIGMTHLANAQPSALQWRDTGIDLPPVAHPNTPHPLCFDTSRPHAIFVNEPGSGTVAYDWITGQRTVVNSRAFARCGPHGLLFADSPPWRFSLDDPAGQPIAYLPWDSPDDGSFQVYSGTGGQDDWFSALWSSADGGLHWQHSEPGGSEHKASLLIYPADARLAYLYSYTPPPDFTMPRIYAYHLTTDAGRTWGLSGPPWPLTEDFIGPFVNSFFLPSHNTPFNLLEREILEFDQSSKKGPGGNGQTIDLSDDGGRTFHELSTLEYDQGMDYLVQTSTSLLRYSDRAYAGDPLAQQLTRSTDGGRTWQVMPRPPLSGGRFDYLGSNTFLQVAPTAPANVFLCDRGALWYSPDAGTTWQPLPASSVVDVHLSPYLPLTVLDVRGTRLYALDLPAAARQLTAPVLPAQAPGSQYFPQTGHNLGNTFLPYWQAHGGLAQLGYPLTDELAQVAATDGRIYMTQYFERAVFERHPENASPYDVLLSLLGVDAYHQHYGAAGAPHQHVSTANPRTFPQTGHTLGGVFRAYWESHGGLAQQGYPISDEFTEVSALNGQPYTVQYFQRAVFEYHPENAGTPYAVLLSQLGTFQARQLGPAPPTPGP